MDIVQEIKTRHQASFDALKQKRVMYDAVEQLFHGILNDHISANTKSQVFDHRLSTLTIERAHRVMAQLPLGRVRGISKNDAVDVQIKNLLLDKYVIPNANAQFDFLTKLRMVDMYSNVYGAFFALVDWDIKPNGYIGPDMWLLNIRDVFPQVGAVSVEDSDYIIVRTWKPLSFFEGLRKEKGFKNIDAIVTKLKDKSGSKHARTSEDLSKRGETLDSSSSPAKGAGYFEVLSQFEGDRWVDVCVDADLEFRDTKNPHENGELPVVAKYSIPLLDDFMGIGDMERGGSMQRTMNSVWNLYLDAVKMSIYPPVMLNKDNIASMSSIKWGAAEKWLVRNQVDNAARTIQLSPQGISTFNNTYQAANASILNLFGTSDTSVSSNVDVSAGKTPQALRMQQARENTRDVADRFYMEKFVTSVMKKMVNLLAKKQPADLSIRMFEDEIETIANEHGELNEFYDRNTGKLRVPKSKHDASLYDWEIVTGSSFAVDQKTQQDNLSSLVSLYQAAQTPNGNMLVADLEKEGFTLKFGELMKRVIANSGIQGWDKILVEKGEVEKANDVLDKDAQVFQNMLQQMQQGGNVNAIPPEPEQEMQGGMQPNMQFDELQGGIGA
jgi:hypothetical protein